MIHFDDCVLIGTIIRYQDKEKKFLLSFHFSNTEKLKKMGSVFVHLNGSLIPFFIGSWTILKGKKALAEIEDLYTQNQIQELIGKEIYLKKELLGEEEEEVVDPYLGLIGYTVLDLQTGKKIGTITAVTETAAHPIASIEHKSFNEEVLLPLITPFIKKIDRKSKVLIATPPSGLLDLYN